MMKRHHTVLFLALLFFSLSELSGQPSSSINKSQPDKNNFYKKPKEILLPPDPNAVFRVSLPPATPMQSITNCNPLVIDTSFQPVPFSGAAGPNYLNDDLSSIVVNLPFTFCFYGVSKNSLFINNNGNITFGSGFSTFVATTFPLLTSEQMIAPFWSDVDTRGAGSGFVTYSLTSTHIIVNWDRVGYFDSHDDLLNTFHLILTDGFDPILPAGQNVQFSYEDMSWTTGDAQAGVGGFPGPTLPRNVATVGINRGNGTDFIQFGLFDQPGNIYDGPFGNNDGIDWLDNQTFTMDICSSAGTTPNVAPVLNSLSACDTLHICQNSTYQFEANYLSPEATQNTSINVNLNGMTGATILSNIGGNTASISISVNGLASNLGYHTITLTATDDGAPAATTVSDIVLQILPSPSPSFTISPNDSVIVNSPVSFTNTTPPGSLLLWNFGDGSPNSPSINPTHTFTAGGDYPVTLTAMSPNGCATVDTQIVHVSLCSLANFNATNSCSGAPSVINYTGSVTPTAIYSWDFNGGTIVSGSGAGPYNISWAAPGSYTVALSVTDGSCVSSISNSVLVAPGPSASLSGTTAVCAGDAVNFNFTGTAGPAAAYTWSFGSGNIISGAGAGPFNVQFNTAAVEPVTLIVSEGGCNDTAVVPVTVNQIPSSTFTVPSAACAGNNLNVVYTGNASPSAIFNWNFNGATISSGSDAGPYDINYTSGGNPSIELSVTENNCTSQVTSIPVQITAAPIASITPITGLCAGQTSTVSYNGTAGAATSYQWTFGSGTVISGSGGGPYTVQWNSPANENVQVIVSENGCIDTAIASVAISQIPTSAFSIQPSACSGEPIAVSYIGVSSSLASFTWNFHGATVISGTDAGPYSIAFNTGGANSVDLSVNDNGCPSAVTSLSVQVTPAPTVSIDASSSLCPDANNIIQFNGSAGSSANYTWSFGNGTVSSGSGAGPYNVSWNTPGPDVIHVDVNENGCTASGDYNVNIYPIPTSDFTIDNVACLGDPLTISYTGTASSTASYSWTFGSATILSGSGSGPYTLSYNTAGPMPVQLTVIENGCSSVVTALQTFINPLPTANAGTDPSSCSGDPVNLGDVSLTGNIYSWSPGNDLSDVNQSNPVATIINHTPVQQLHDYILTVIDADGCKNTDTVEVATNPDPSVSFSPLNGQCIEGNKFVFNGYSNIASGVDFSWSFQGPSSITNSSAKTVEVSYASTGTYPVLLNGTFNGCASVPYTDSVNIFEMPVSDFASLSTAGCLPLSVSFSNLSSGNQNSYNWSFGDGQVDNSENAVHTFESAGTFSVSLSAMNIHGCVTDTTYKDLISVYALPDGQFSPNPSIANILAPVIQFQNHSGNTVSYMWDFGDADTSTEWSPTHTFADTGNYNVTLVLVSDLGCVDTVTGFVRVEDNYSFYIPKAFTPNGDGVNDYFKGYGVAINSYRMNIFDRWGGIIYSTNDLDRPWDGKQSSGSIQSGTYVYKIEIVDQHDEAHEYTGSVTVLK